MPAPLVEFVFQAVNEGSTELIHHTYGPRVCLIAFVSAVGLIAIAITVGKIVR